MVKRLNNKLLILLLSIIFSSHSVASKNQLTEQLTVVGQGDFSWLFIDLYQATLYSHSGQYAHKSYPQALNITYQKDINKEKLISATKKEWRKLSLVNDQQADWLAQLNTIWPDIKKGDQLLFMVNQGGSGFFYHNAVLLGSVNSNQFSDAFLAIWLSPNTSETALRKQLIGEGR